MGGYVRLVLLVLAGLMLTGPLLAQPGPERRGAPNGDREGKPLFGPEPPTYKVFLGPLLASDDACNDIDRWLADIARSDGDPMVLDARDFVRGMRDEVVDAFLLAAGRYVQTRWIKGQRDDVVGAHFLDEIAKLDLPPRYTVFLLYGSADIGRLRRGHLIGQVSGSYAASSSQIQSHTVDWGLTGTALGVEGLWPWRADPYQGRWPLLYIGAGLQASRASGTLTEGETKHADVDRFELGLQLLMHARYTVSPTLLLKAGVGTGFGAGTLKVDTVWEQGLEDPCKLDPSVGLDLDAAGKAVRCNVTTSFGFFQSYPVVATVGAQVLGWLNLDLVYARTAYQTDKAVFAPEALHEVGLRLGMNVY